MFRVTEAKIAREKAIEALGEGGGAEEVGSKERDRNEERRERQKGKEEENKKLAQEGWR